MIIAVTGSFGTGKSTVSSIFQKQGFNMINVDNLYHSIFKKNPILKLRIFLAFATTDREKIKKIVFTDKEKLKKLNSITHPLILKELKKEIVRLTDSDKLKPIIVDIPLLFEAKAENLVDSIIVVKCDKKTQISRLLKKGRWTKEEIEEIISSQMPISKKIKKANYVIDNSKSLKETEKQVKKIIKLI